MQLHLSVPPQNEQSYMNCDHIKAAITDLATNVMGPMHCRPKHTSICILLMNGNISMEGT